MEQQIAKSIFNKKTIIILIVIVALIALAAWLFMSDEDTTQIGEGGTLCFAPKTGQKTWNLEGIDWTDYTGGVVRYLEDKEKYYSVALAYFKAVDVQAGAANVRRYKKEIMKLAQAEPEIEHWEVNVGEFVCV